MPTVLIIEDEANIRQFVELNLKARGYEVLTVESAEDGLQQLRIFVPALLILDIRLPGMSGWELLKLIDGDPTLPKVPVIVMTASSLITNPGEFPYERIIEKLSKPLSVEQLLGAVRKVFTPQEQKGE